MGKSYQRRQPTTERIERGMAASPEELTRPAITGIPFVVLDCDSEELPVKFVAGRSRSSESPS